MFRRTLVAAALTLLVAMLATFLYAVLNQSSPLSVLARAERALGQGDGHAAIRELDWCERSHSTQAEPELQQKLLRLRYRAWRQLGDQGSLQHSLQDLERLLQLLPRPEDELLLDRIWLEASTDQGELALQHGREYLRLHPEDGRALELCGDACRVRYRSELVAIAEQVWRDLAGQAQLQARRALLAFLYRPDADPGVDASLAELDRVYGRGSLQPTWLRLRPRLLALRKQVQMALDYYRQSLEQPGERVTAFQQLTFALGQSGRNDDLVAQSLLYMRRFQNVYTAEAAGIAAAALLRDGLATAAARVADEFLPSTSIAQRLERRELDARLGPLLQTKALALWQLQDQRRLDQLNLECWQLWQAGVDVATARQIAGGLAALLGGRDADAADELGSACEQLARSGPPADGDDPLALLTPLRLRALQGIGAPVSARLSAIELWQQAPGRDRTLAPLLLRARFQLQAGLTSAALTTVDELRQRAPRDDEVLALWCEASAAAGAVAGQDGPGLLQQCQRREATAPDSTDPVAFLICAEAALAEARLASTPQPLRHFDALVARECARAAIAQFRWARRPRLLLAMAELQLDRAATAADELDALAEQLPDDAEVQHLRLLARVQAGREPGPALAAAAGCSGYDATVHKALLRQALPLADDKALRALVAAGDPATIDVELLALRAAAQARIGLADQAAATLQRALRQLPADDPGPDQLAAAAAAVLAARLPAADDAPARERELLQWLPAASRGGADVAAVWLRAARTCAERRQPLAAWLLASSALDLPGAEPLRDGEQFAFAAGMALQLGHLAAAERLYAAAISFADGAAAAEPLARLCLLHDQPQRAAAALQLQPEPQDPALLLRLDPRANVLPLLREALALDAGDLLATCTLPLATQVAPSACGFELGQLEASQRDEALTLLALLRQPELGRAALPLAQALAASLPQSQAAQLLLARAELQAGDPAAAARRHAALADAAVGAPLLCAEAVRAARTPGYAVPPAVLAGLKDAAGAPGAPPALAQFVGRAAAMTALQSGHDGIALQMLATLWLRDPAASEATAADADQLFQHGRQSDALVLLTRLLELAPAAQRPALQRHLFRSYALVQDPRLRDFGRRQALAALDADADATAALQFLLLDQEQREVPDALQLPAARAEALLVEQIADAGAAADAELGLDLLRRLAGADRAAAAAERLLQQQPWLGGVWVRHATALAQLQQPAAACAELRAVRQYLADPWLDLAAVTLAAEHRRLEPGDRELLAALPAGVRDSAPGQRAVGLMALRDGDGAAAAAALQRVLAAADGSHLYFRALAALLLPEPSALARAAELFAAVVADYPSSSLARYAGSFARQLASR